MRNRRYHKGITDPQILIANALVNLDPSSIVTSGSNVTGWNNIGTGGSAYNTTTATAAGTIVTSTLNGYTVPSAAGAGYMADDVEPQTSQPNTLIVVAKPSVNPTTATMAICDGSDGAGERHFLYSSATSGNPSAFAGTTLTLSQTLDQNTRVWSAIFNGASSKLTVHGLGSVSGNAGTNPFSWSFLFCDTTTGSRYQGQIAQFLWWNQVLTENQIESVYRFLRAKFAAA